MEGGSHGAAGEVRARRGVVVVEAGAGGGGGARAGGRGGVDEGRNVSGATAVHGWERWGVTAGTRRREEEKRW